MTIVCIHSATVYTPAELKPVNGLARSRVDDRGHLTNVTAMVYDYSIRESGNKVLLFER